MVWEPNQPQCGKDLCLVGQRSFFDGKNKTGQAENPKKYNLSKVGGGAGRKNAGQIQNHHTPEGFFDRLPEKKNRKKANDGTESKQTDIFAGGEIAVQ